MKPHLCLALVAIAACAEDPAPPTVDPVGPAEVAAGRRVRRLTAEQFHRSLEIATGQTWSRYAAFAAALGRPDYGDIVDEGRDLSITFDKLVHDAARETCAEAVAADRGGRDVILRAAAIGDRDDAAFAANLRYLYRRFLGFTIDDAADPRLAPWLGLLRGAEPAATDDVMAARWTAVCVGLATHPDFLTY